MQVGGAADALGFFSGLRQRGQQQSGEDCDDRDHDQQFDQGEKFRAFVGGFHFSRLLGVFFCFVLFLVLFVCFELD